jgi:hypothetical protein
MTSLRKEWSTIRRLLLIKSSWVKRSSVRKKTTRNTPNRDPRSGFCAR